MVTALPKVPTLVLRYGSVTMYCMWIYVPGRYCTSHFVKNMSEDGDRPRRFILYEASLMPLTPLIIATLHATVIHTSQNGYPTFRQGESPAHVCALSWLGNIAIRSVVDFAHLLPCADSVPLDPGTIYEYIVPACPCLSTDPVRSSSLAIHADLWT